MKIYADKKNRTLKTENIMGGWKNEEEMHQEISGLYDPDTVCCAIV